MGRGRLRRRVACVPVDQPGRAGRLGNIGDVVNQPGDVSFVIDEVLAASEDPESPLHGVVDPEAIGVVGHSLGGATTWAVAFNTATRDERIDSAMVFAGLTLPCPEASSTSTRASRCSSCTGTPTTSPSTWTSRPTSRRRRRSGSSPCSVRSTGSAFTDEASPYDELVTRTLLDFWHGTLDGDDEALERVTADATDPELSPVLHE